jgi:hypothetical protein
VALKRRIEGELGLRVISEVEEEKVSSCVSISNSEEMISRELEIKEKQVAVTKKKF